MALPGEVFPSIAVIILVPPTLTEEYAVSTPTVLTPVGDEELRLPVTLPVTFPSTLPVTLPVRAPLKLVAVATPVTTAPLEKPTEPLSSLFTISSTCKL